MGIHDRDYYREPTNGMFDAWGRLGVTVWIVIITTVIFFAQVLSRDAAGVREIGRSPVSEALIYNYEDIKHGEIWRLITPVFLHAGILHLACNMFVLFWTGKRLEAKYGSREFLLFYLVSGVFANLLSLIATSLDLTAARDALGASGAVTAVFVLFACNYPREQVLLFLVIPLPVWLVAVLYVVLDSMGAMGSRISNQSIGYVVHLGGALFGFSYYKFGLRIESLGRSSLPARKRSVPRLRVIPSDALDTPTTPRLHISETEDTEVPVQPSEDPLEVRVDRILAKVSKSGQGSLTSDERELLFRASEHYKKRRN